jgi:hypothetical protein
MRTAAPSFIQFFFSFFKKNLSHHLVKIAPDYPKCGCPIRQIVAGHTASAELRSGEPFFSPAEIKRQFQLINEDSRSQTRSK